jgi:hypothetical protein
MVPRLNWIAERSQSFCWPHGARALRRGSSEIIMRPVNGSLGPRIKSGKQETQADHAVVLGRAAAPHANAGPPARSSAVRQ